MKNVNVLPNMLISGAPKSGTTTLWAYLHDHPDVFMAPKKELWFFLDDEVWSKGLDWYARQFEGYQGKKIIGEATPLYMYSEKALNRIQRTIPDIKLIFIFRNPAERAFSHYWHNIKKLKDNVSFEQAISEDMENQRENALVRGSLQYFDLGRYYSYLQKWYEKFSEKSIFVIIFEEMIANRQNVLRGLFHFLQVDNSIIQNKDTKKNPGEYFRYNWMSSFYKESRFKEFIVKHIPVFSRKSLEGIRHKVALTRNKPIMNQETRNMLLSAYQNEIFKLEDLLGKDLSIWAKY